MLRWRLLLGSLFIAALAGLCWLDTGPRPGRWLGPLAVLLAAAATQEMFWLYRSRGLAPLAWPAYVGNVGMVIAAAAAVWLNLPQHVLTWPACVLALAMASGFVGEMARYRQPGTTSELLGLGMMALVYVGLCLAFLVALRVVAPDPAGIVALASLIIVVKMCDTGAYTMGRLLGRHKLAPLLSPGKTVEEAWGGLVWGVGAAVLTFALLVPALGGFGTAPWWRWAIYGALVAIAGTAGDLAESLLKRDLGRKDSSPWMPGFGGVLDLLDSVLLAAPIAWLCWKTGLVWLR
ncbi:MAG: phosphatidate cytidylyltransferase [Pirellulales bacterium]|nr:phosphatidate cytidylyltransferase [Pirellulales bacterium]